MKKMVKFCHTWFGHVWRVPVEALVWKVDQMESSLIVRGRGRPRKTIGETIKRDLNFNDLNVNMIYDRTLWRRLIYVANLGRGLVVVVLFMDRNSSI